MPGPHSGKRKAIGLDVKRDVIKRKEEGQGNSAIGRALGLSESTVRTIWKNKSEILRSIKAYGITKLDTRKRTRDERVIKMERYLEMWINRKEREGSAIDKRAIQEQAMSFYTVICRKSGSSLGNFRASTGWLYRFLQRKEIRNIKFTGESASADRDAASQFPAILKAVIDEGNYHPDCIYNMDEAGLQYKKMPSSTFLAKQIKRARGRKADKARITVLFCCNLTGSHKMKPLVVHTAKHPRCYKHLSDMSAAPVYWRSTKNGWITSSIVKSWLLNCFVTDARSKCRQLGLPFNVLLIMDNCPAHSAYLADLHPKVKVLFLPPKTTSIIQPLDQEFIGTVKAIYQKRLYRLLRDKTESGEEVRQIIAEADAEQEDADIDDLPPVAHTEADEDIIRTFTNPKVISVHQFWRQFTVKDAIDHLLQAWKDISIATVRHAWRPLTPHLVSDESGDAERGQVQQLGDAVADAAAAARQVPGFEEVTSAEITEINSAGDTMAPEGIMNVAAVEDTLEEEQASVREQSTAQEAQPAGEPTMSQLSRILASADSFRNTILENECSTVRVNELFDQFSKVVRYYTDLHSKRVNDRRQTLITRFIRPTTPQQPQPEPQPGPSHQDDDAMSVVSELDFEGFLQEADAIRDSVDVPAISECDEDDDDAGAAAGDAASRQ